MKIVNKIIIFCSVVIFFMLLMPMIIINFSHLAVDTGFMISLLFLVYPIVSMGVGALAGTDIRRLWWMPLAMALAFPFLFSLAIFEMVWDFFIYSIMYLVWGFVFMALTAFTVRIVRKSLERQKNEKHGKK